jgi:hypothetical protein
VDDSDQSIDTKGRLLLAHESINLPLPPESISSRYSQQSLPPPQPARTTTRMSYMEPRDRNVDLEKGFAPELHGTRPPLSWEDYNQAQENSTTLTVVHRPSSSTSTGELSKIHAHCYSQAYLISRILVRFFPFRFRTRRYPHFTSTRRSAVKGTASH